jgi:hypothetical protein
VDVHYRADGTILLRFPIPLGGCERHICAYFDAKGRLLDAHSFPATTAKRGLNRY